MKKIYTFLLTGLLFTQNTEAQITLLPQYHEPVAGEVMGSREYDSTSAIPKNVGASQTWDFSSLVMTTVTAMTSTFVAPSSIPSNTAFPGATLADNDGQGNHSFFKSATTPTTQFEVLGLESGGVMFTYTNSMVYMVWPMTYGNSFTDTFSGSMTTSTLNASVTGTVTTTGSGFGTMILPGGAVLNDALQLKSTMTINTALTTTATVNTTNNSIQYIYYHGTQKFPILSVDYEIGTPPNPGSVSITVNHLLAVGLNDYNFDASFAIYPNPAKDNFNVKLSNGPGEICTIEIYNATGQLAKNFNLGHTSHIESSIPLTGLSAGIYVVKTSLGTKSSTRKLIVE